MLLPESQPAPTAQPGQQFIWLATQWLLVEGRRLVCPDNERRHLVHLRPLWDCTEATLTPRRVKAHLLSLLKANGGPLGPSTVNKLRSTGMRAIRDAQINGEWRSLNPFELCPRAREEEPRWTVLTIPQVRRMLKHLRTDRRREAVVMLVLGPRPGELKAIRKVDVDVLRRTLTWRRSNANNFTKTRRSRTVPLPAPLWELFRKAIEESPSEYVFPAPGGGLQSKHSKLSRMLRTALARAGVVEGYRYTCRRSWCRAVRGQMRPTREKDARCPACNMRLWVTARGLNMRWYDLRHCAATLHWRARCDPLVVARVLGHSVKGTTAKTYVHLDAPYMRRELGRLVARLRVL